MPENNENICDQLAELISAYFDQQLDPDQMQAVEQHLGQCPDCRKKLDDYQKIRDAIASGKVSPPIDLAQTVLAKLEREQLLGGLETFAETPAPRAMKFLRALAAAAVICVVMTGAFLMVKFGGAGPPRERADKADSGVKVALSEDREQVSRLAQKPTPQMIAADKLNVPPQVPEAGGSGSLKGTSADERANPEAKEKVARARRPKRAVFRASDPQERSLAEGLGRGAKIAPAGRVGGPTEGLAVRPVPRSVKLNQLPSAPPDRPVRVLLPQSASKPTEKFTAYHFADRVPARIKLQAQDTPSWMYVKGRLETTFQRFGLTEIEADQIDQYFDADEKEFFSPLPRARPGGGPMHHKQFLVAIRPERFDQLTTAIRQMPAALRELAGPVSAEATGLPKRADDASRFYKSLRSREAGAQPGDHRTRLQRAFRAKKPATQKVVDAKTHTRPAVTTMLIVELEIKDTATVGRSKARSEPATTDRTAESTKTESARMITAGPTTQPPAKPRPASLPAAPHSRKRHPAR